MRVRTTASNLNSPLEASTLLLPECSTCSGASAGSINDLGFSLWSPVDCCCDHHWSSDQHPRAVRCVCSAHLSCSSFSNPGSLRCASWIMTKVTEDGSCHSPRPNHVVSACVGVGVVYSGPAMRAAVLAFIASVCFPWNIADAWYFGGRPHQVYMLSENARICC